MLSFSHWKEPLSPGAYFPYRNYACIAQQSPLASVNGNQLCALHPQRGLMIASSGVSLFYGARVIYTTSHQLNGQLI